MTCRTQQRRYFFLPYCTSCTFLTRYPGRLVFELIRNKYLPYLCCTNLHGLNLNSVHIPSILFTSITFTFSLVLLLSTPENVGNENNVLFYLAEEFVELLLLSPVARQTLQFLRVDAEWQLAAQDKLDGLIDVVPLPKASSVARPVGAPRMTVEIKGDGNCWFRSISYLMTGSQEHHAILRAKVTTFMQDNLREAVNRFSFTEDKPDYFDGWLMQGDGEWATEVEIMSTAAFLKTDIYTFTRTPKRFNGRLKKWQQSDWHWQKFSAGTLLGKKGKTSKGENKSIYIHHQNLNHYMPVLSVY